MTTSPAVLPLVAFRGLWDKFAAPGTAGAVRRALLRGIPTRVCVERGTPALADALALAADPNVNRHAQPVYLSSSTLPLLDDMRRVAAPAVFATVRGRHDRPWVLWTWTGRAWLGAGCYVPLGACADLERLPTPLPPGLLVLYESRNVADPAASAAPEDIDDTRTVRALGRLAEPDALIIRVSDLVELDLRDMVRREAA